MVADLHFAIGHWCHRGRIGATDSKPDVASGMSDRVRQKGGIKAEQVKRTVRVR
jgi:hypothetical protein